ncbi:MAG TPA: hypothetical protein VE422_30090 [Terriglobia bacterium]|nr:hypothetical protein [Terriglobia bacterium]
MHLSPETALDFLEGRLENGQETLWKQHLEVCGRCAEYLSGWKQFLTTIKRSHLKSPSDQSLDRAVHLFPPEPDELVPRLRCVLAAVIFDSFLEPDLVGARGVSNDMRQLVLQAEDFDIHVQIWNEGGQRQMLGQMLPMSREPLADTARFHLLRNGKRLETMAADELGEFHFDDLPDGTLSLQVDLPNLTIIGALNI